MNQRDARKLELLDRALTIAADMFAAEGYCSDYGDPSPDAIRNFLLRKAREELRELTPPKKEPPRSPAARVRGGEEEGRSGCAAFPAPTENRGSRAERVSSDGKPRTL